MAEVKISELSVGDWVRVINQFNAQIDGYHSESGSLSLKTRQGNLVHYRLEDIHPIPLTPEILKKNGWECIAVGDNGPATPKEHYNRYEKWRCESKWGYRDLFLDRMTKRWRLSGMNCTTFTEFHKLQHALRISGFEKEIEL